MQYKYAEISPVYQTAAYAAGGGLLGWLLARAMGKNKHAFHYALGGALAGGLGSGLYLHSKALKDKAADDEKRRVANELAAAQSGKFTRAMGLSQPSSSMPSDTPKETKQLTQAAAKARSEQARKNMGIIPTVRDALTPMHKDKGLNLAGKARDIRDYYADVITRYIYGKNPQDAVAYESPDARVVARWEQARANELARQEQVRKAREQEQAWAEADAEGELNAHRDAGESPVPRGGNRLVGNARREADEALRQQRERMAQARLGELFTSGASMDSMVPNDNSVMPGGKQSRRKQSRRPRTTKAVPDITEYSGAYGPARSLDWMSE
jgi:hypothetical protein